MCFTRGWSFKTGMATLPVGKFISGLRFCTATRNFMRWPDKSCSLWPAFCGRNSVVRRRASLSIRWSDRHEKLDRVGILQFRCCLDCRYLRTACLASVVCAFGGGALVSCFGAAVPFFVLPLLVAGMVAR